MPGGAVATKRRAQLIKEIYWTPLTLTPAHQRRSAPRINQRSINTEEIIVPLPQVLSGPWVRGHRELHTFTAKTIYSESDVR